MHRREPIFPGGKSGLATLIAALALMIALPAMAGQIDGVWIVKMDYEGNLTPATLVFKTVDGKITGKWSSPNDESDLKNIKFENGKITFRRKFNLEGEQIDLDYQGTIQGDKISGAFVTPLGPMPANGMREVAEAGKGEPADEEITGPVEVPGIWTFTAQLDETETAEFTFTAREEEGKITGVLVTDLGNFTFDDIKVDGNKIDFQTEIEMEGLIIPVGFAGSIGGDRVKGVFTVNLDGEQLSFPIRGVRTRDAALSGPVRFPGKWRLTFHLDERNSRQMAIVFKEESGQLSATIETEEGTHPVEALKVFGNSIEFHAPLQRGEEKIDLHVVGSAAGDRIDATATYKVEDESRHFPVEGVKVIEEILTGPANLPGSWKLVTTDAQGEVYESILEIEEVEGQLTAVLTTANFGSADVETIRIEGNQFHFKLRLEIEGELIPVEVLGSTAGDRIEARVLVITRGEPRKLSLSGSRVIAEAP